MHDVWASTRSRRNKRNDDFILSVLSIICHRKKKSPPSENQTLLHREWRSYQCRHGCFWPTAVAAMLISVVLQNHGSDQSFAVSGKPSLLLGLRKVLGLGRFVGTGPSKNRQHSSKGFRTFEVGQFRGNCPSQHQVRSSLVQT